VSNPDPKAPLARLQELSHQLERAQVSGQKAVAEVTKAKKTTKRVKAAVAVTVAQLRRELTKKKKKLRSRKKPKHR
jgi:hypothetical protein